MTLVSGVFELRTYLLFTFYVDFYTTLCSSLLFILMRCIVGILYNVQLRVGPDMIAEPDPDTPLIKTNNLIFIQIVYY